MGSIIFKRKVAALAIAILTIIFFDFTIRSAIY